MVTAEGQGPEPTPQFLPGLEQPEAHSLLYPSGAACHHCSPSLLPTSARTVEPGYVEGNILDLAAQLTLRKDYNTVCPLRIHPKETRNAHSKGILRNGNRAKVETPQTFIPRRTDRGVVPEWDIRETGRNMGQDCALEYKRIPRTQDDKRHQTQKSSLS